MGMRVDSAGQEQEAGGIDDFIRGDRGNARADFLDGCAVDQQIGFYAGVGVYYRSVLNKRLHDGIFLISCPGKLCGRGRPHDSRSRDRRS